MLNASLVLIFFHRPSLFLLLDAILLDHKTTQIHHRTMMCKYPESPSLGKSPSPTLASSSLLPLASDTLRAPLVVIQLEDVIINYMPVNYDGMQSLSL